MTHDDPHETSTGRILRGIVNQFSIETLGFNWLYRVPDRRTPGEILKDHEDYIRDQKRIQTARRKFAGSVIGGTIVLIAGMIATSVYQALRQRLGLP